ncbi:hypothetical protein EXS45_01145 [Candidatus Nomurabacteria bacterium]|nr:hypothetical protein [Candidatus Nomurabacteria bacterium]
MKKKHIHWLFLIFPVLLFISFFTFPKFFSNMVSFLKSNDIIWDKKITVSVFLPLDTVAYDKKLNELANNPTPEAFESKPASLNLWPVKTVYPNTGAILPFNRIIAYYGNLYSTKMGVLGEYPEDEMLKRLDTEVKKWEVADPNTPVLSALHYIAVVAQSFPGSDGKYRSRMPGSEIDKVLGIADKANAIVFLDFQVGFSDLQTEVPLFEKYLKLPHVHLGVDAEFSMKAGIRPGKMVGTLDAEDINFTTNYIAKIVRENNLPPKVLVVHRYTKDMITNYKMINILPEVQIVMHMDGWGEMAKKIGTYKYIIYPEPVQFTGFKLFYKNDIATPGTVLMTPQDLLKLSPQPIYIQYQ